MSDYANCPTCHGRGVVSMETTDVITAHADANAELERFTRRERDRLVAEQTLARRLADAEKRMRDLEALLSSTPQRAAP